MKTTEELMHLAGIYANSTPNAAEAWNHLVIASNLVGWKDIYFMVLRLQKEVAPDSGYQLKPSH